MNKKNRLDNCEEMIKKTPNKIAGVLNKLRSHLDRHSLSWAKCDNDVGIAVISNAMLAFNYTLPSRRDN